MYIINTLICTKYNYSVIPEIDLGTNCVVDMEDSQTILHHPSTENKDRSVFYLGRVISLQLPHSRE